MRSRAKWLEWHFYTAKRVQLLRKKVSELIHSKDITPTVRRKLYTIDRIIESPRGLLDDHYHEIITDAEFNKWGHIYYNSGGKKENRTGINKIPEGSKNLIQEQWDAIGRKS